MTLPYEKIHKLFFRHLVHIYLNTQVYYPDYDAPGVQVYNWEYIVGYKMVSDPLKRWMEAMESVGEEQGYCGELQLWRCLAPLSAGSRLNINNIYFNIWFLLKRTIIANLNKKIAWRGVNAYLLSFSREKKILWLSYLLIKKLLKLLSKLVFYYKITFPNLQVCVVN